MYGLFYDGKIIYVDEHYAFVKEEFNEFIKNEDCDIDDLEIKEVECSIEKYEINDDILDKIVDDIVNHYTKGEENLVTYFNEAIVDRSDKNSLKFLLEGVVDIWTKRNGLDMCAFTPKK